MSSTTDESLVVRAPSPRPGKTLENQHRARNSLVINLLLVSTFVVILNETVMSVATPRLMADLGISASSAQWLTSGFLLTMAIIIPISGFLLQRFHTRQLFIAAMSLFLIGTLLAALSPGFELLLIARIIQAGGTAVMVPLLMTTAMTLEPPATRGRRMGSITVVIAVAPAIGPTIAGLILSQFSWRFLFAIMLPLAAVALILGVRRMQNVTEPRPTPVDVLSIVLAALGFGGIVFGLSHIGETGGHIGPGVIAPLAFGAAALAVFIARQVTLQRRDRALLDLRTFTTPSFTLSLVVLAICALVLFGSLILLPLYMQNVLGFTVLQSGLMLLPGGLAMGLSSPVIGRIYDRFGPPPVAIPGTMLITLAMAALTLLSVSTPWWAALPIHVVLSVGLALTFTPLFSAALGSLPTQLYSHGSATINTAQQVAGAIGTAVFISTMAAVSTAHTESGASAQEAVAAGVHAAFLIGAAVSVLGIIVAAFIRKPRTASSTSSTVTGH
ncbi:MDR family MFS transporter [Arthrobacter sedimenti]|uniref:MDR family MFS transporter n=1 Tax=Arthrobacter sedimenti TaxID=2694931 RepID=UPI000B55D7B9|nr:MDR family MFS transporter [Arthrobacter sedimenti]OUM45648.1 MFS transporter [Arthrobacter agilis]